MREKVSIMMIVAGWALNSIQKVIRGSTERSFFKSD